MRDKRTGQGREERLRKQREYQRRYRDRKRAGKVVQRDDIARELLHFAITENLINDRVDKLMLLVDTIVGRLAEKGFDAELSKMVFGGLIDKYEAGWIFRRKVHLIEKPMKLEDLIEQ